MRAWMFGMQPWSFEADAKCQRSRLAKNHLPKVRGLSVEDQKRESPPAGKEDGGDAIYKAGGAGRWERGRFFYNRSKRFPA